MRLKDYEKLSMLLPQTPFPKCQNGLSDNLLVCFIPVELRMILIPEEKVELLLQCRLLPVDLKLRLDLLE